jgi:cytidylate kinase
LIITIDGPAGSGKSTVARKIAKKLGIIHLNSGALFRAIGLKAKRTGVELDDEGAVARLAAATEFEFVLSPIDEKVGSRDTCLLVDGKDIDEQLGSAEASMLASRIAVQSKLRDVLLRVQRELSLKHSLVVEGRDAGTVVFPNAEFKFYLDADIRVRAERRFAEQQDALDVDAVQAELEARDHRDATREIAPQVAADDATVIDTSELGIDEVVEELCGRIKVASL